MDNQQKITLKLLRIPVMDVLIHANFILIKRLNVGMLDVWVNVLHHAIPHVPHHALVDV